MMNLIFFYYSGIQANHRITTTMQRRIYGHATDVEIRPLNEEKAVQNAVDLLGEMFIFSVGTFPFTFTWGVFEVLSMLVCSN